MTAPPFATEAGPLPTLSFLPRGEARAVPRLAAQPGATPVAPAAAAKTLPVSWDELHRHSRALAWRLIELGPWQGIIAVTRGGLVPAAIVARELDVRLVDTVCISSYAARERGAVDSERGPIQFLKRVPAHAPRH